MHMHVLLSSVLCAVIGQKLKDFLCLYCGKCTLIVRYIVMLFAHSLTLTCIARYHNIFQRYDQMWNTMSPYEKGVKS